MEKKIRDLLEEDFPESMIKRRRGRTGESIAYVGSPAFIQRLNDSFDGDWSFEIVEWHELHGEAVVLARITGPDGITKEQFGNSTISVYGAKHARAGEIVSFGDDLKAAASDALKKCSTLFGVGLSVYGGEKAGIQKEGDADQEEDPLSALLANIQRGEEALSKKLKCEVSDLRNEFFNVDTDLTDLPQDKLDGYLAHLRSVRDADESKQPPETTPNGGTGNSGGTAAEVQAKALKTIRSCEIYLSGRGYKPMDLRKESLGKTALGSMATDALQGYVKNLQDLRRTEEEKEGDE